MKTFFLLFLLAISHQVIAKQIDTSAYQTQRIKVNALLNQRSAKFGQYDQSLDAKTGIFGLQTKSDVKNSNEILRQIVLNDNNIFKELKILMEYKDQEVIAAKNTASEVKGRMLNYMQSIKKLQEENERIKSNNKTTSLAGSAIYIILILIAALIGTYFYFHNRLQNVKIPTNEKRPF
ncbi:hypothetical protein [Pedobacter sp. JCM 36344]|uniref:hypothetical protein n=1 Tax=Pedobacter sp. JCM 36344 TaxID=3374280 RepID=UPI00397C0895